MRRSQCMDSGPSSSLELEGSKSSSRQVASLVIGHLRSLEDELTLFFFIEEYSGTGLESKVCVRATIGLFECISEPNFRSPFAYVCSEPGVSFNTSMWMDHANKPQISRNWGL